MILMAVSLFACKATLKFENGALLDVEVRKESFYADRDTVNVVEDNKGILTVSYVEKNINYWVKYLDKKSDLMFVNSEKEIVKVVLADACKKWPCQRYSSGEPARYVVQAEAGWCERNDVKAGQFVRY